MNDIKNLKVTCNQIASCLPGTKFVETRNGGYFVKGNRKLGAVVSPSSDVSSVKINKWKDGFGLNVNPKQTMDYISIKKSVKRGLGIKD